MRQPAAAFICGTGSAEAPPKPPFMLGTFAAASDGHRAITPTKYRIITSGEPAAGPFIAPLSCKPLLETAVPFSSAFGTCRLAVFTQAQSASGGFYHGTLHASRQPLFPCTLPPAGRKPNYGRSQSSSWYSPRIPKHLVSKGSYKDWPHTPVKKHLVSANRRPQN